MILPLDPVTAAARLAGRPGRVLLHSARDDDGCGRWSFVASDPIATLSGRGTLLHERDAAGRLLTSHQADPLATLAAFAGTGSPSQSSDFAGKFGDTAHPPGKIRQADTPPLPRLIGFLGYELGHAIARVRGAVASSGATPDLWFGRYAAVYRHDAVTGLGEVVGEPAAAARLRALLSAETDKSAPTPGPPRFGALVADDADRGYRGKVERILDYIAAGDVYQVNLARRLVAPLLADGDALALYRALAAAAPAPFGGLIEAGEVRVLSGSPERFLQRAAGSDRLETRPIKGTRRRTGDPAADAAAAAALAADEKERAEHLMIVDLERNDLGRVAVIGSVAVDVLGQMVALPQLFHLVSTVSCRVRADAGLADILRATFPGGSITGAPKLRAMEIIAELEASPRGPYTGAIGWIGDGGALDLAIAIRTAVLADGALHLHVGGGIVADSTPARELEETEEKAAGWRAALAACAER